MTQKIDIEGMYGLSCDGVFYELLFSNGYVLKLDGTKKNVCFVVDSIDVTKKMKPCGYYKTNGTDVFFTMDGCRFYGTYNMNGAIVGQGVIMSGFYRRIVLPFIAEHNSISFELETQMENNNERRNQNFSNSNGDNIRRDR